MATQKEEPKLRMLCEKCGSPLVTRDAWAEWNEDEQDWVLGAVYDYAFCHTCQADAHIKEVPLEE
jgi:hypothetical protein